MSAKDYKILSSMNQTQQRVAGNSLVTEPGTLLTKIGNFVTKADADNLVMGIAMHTQQFPNDNETTIQEKVFFRPTTYVDQYYMNVKTGETASILNVGILYDIYTDPVTGEQQVDISTTGDKIEIVDIITDTVVVVQFIPQGGPTGSQGVQGAQGSQGPQGPQGVDGALGPQGAQGDAGPQGTAGAQGDTGSQGAQGATGSQGATGPQGTTGAQGPQGEDSTVPGPQGTQGATGPQGAQGVAGGALARKEVWDAGTTYVVNDGVSWNGSSYTCILGHTNQEPPNATYRGVIAEGGDDGAQGAQGATGAQGSTGAQGNQGTQGATGPQGSTGSQGPQGSTGAQGAQGNQGTQGNQGATGSTGPQGAQGNQGTQGNQGAQGSQGATGAQGAQGEQGATATPSVTSTASSATPTATGGSLFNELYVTALAEGATLSEPSGTPVNGNRLIIRIKDNGTARAIGYNAIFRAVGVTLPTTTVINKTLYLGCVYNSQETKWDVIAVAQQA